MRNAQDEYATQRPHGGADVSMDALLALRHVAAAARARKPRRAPRQPRTASRVATRGRGMDYAESRNYQPGDEVRHIDWRVTARTTRLHTKLFVEERERPVLLLVDYGASMQFGTRRAFKAVAAAEMAALLAWRAVREGDRVGLVVCDGAEHTEIAPASGSRGALRVLHALVAHDGDAKDRLEQDAGRADASPVELLRRARRAARPGTSIHVLSDFRCPPAAFDALHAEARQLAAHAELHAWFCYDPLEADAPPPGRYVVGDGRRAGVLDTYSRATREHHAAGFARHRNACEALSQRLAMQFSEMSTATLPEHVLSALATPVPAPESVRSSA